MKRFIVGLGIGVIFGFASVGIMLAWLFHISESRAGAIAEPTVLLENDRVKVLSLTLEPGQATQIHTHQFDEVVICLESGKIRITKTGEEPEGQIVQPKFGDVFMPKVKGVSHVLTNAGETRYRQISIELKEKS